MQRIKIRNHFNARDLVKVGEVNFSPSKTIPDQTMSIRELMQRYAKGLPLGANERVPQYDEDENDVMPDLAHMDLVDRAEYLQNRYGYLEEKLKAAGLAKEKQKLDDLVEQEIKKRGLVSGPSGAPLGV